MCKGEEGSIDNIPTMILRQLVFFLSSIVWVLHSLEREMLLVGMGSL